MPAGVSVHGMASCETWGSRLFAATVGKRSGLWDIASTWTADVRSLVKKVIHNSVPDVVLTSGPPHSVHLIGRWVKRTTNSVWAADFRDPLVAGRWHGEPPTALERWRERSLVTTADLVIANTPRARDTYRKYYPDLYEKFVAITNGYDAAPLLPHEPCGNGPIRIVHAGEIYAGRDPRPLLDAIARRSAEIQRIEIEFLGRVHGMSLEEESQRRGLAGRVRAKGHVSSAEAKRAMALADIQLLMDTPGRQIGVPAKIYEYISFGRPILALAERDSDTAWALQESGVPFALAPPGDVDAIAAAVMKAVALASGTPTALPPQAAQFSRASIARQLSEHLGRLMSSKQSETSDRVTHSNVSLDQASKVGACAIDDVTSSPLSENCPQVER